MGTGQKIYFPIFFFFQIHLFIFCLHHWIIFSRLMDQEKNLNKSFSFLFFSFLNEKRLSDSVGSANWQLRAEESSRSPARYPQANKFQLFLGRSKFQSSFNVIESTKTLFMSSISVFIINNFSSIYHWKKKGKKKKKTEKRKLKTEPATLSREFLDTSKRSKRSSNDFEHLFYRFFYYIPKKK